MCASMKLAVFMDIEVRSGCVSIESGFFMDVEVRSGCSADPSARRVGPQMIQRHPGVAKGVFWTVFGTDTLPTGAPEASRLGEMVLYRTFGTATLPTGTSGTS